MSFIIQLWPIMWITNGIVTVMARNTRYQSVNSAKLRRIVGKSIGWMVECPGIGCSTNVEIWLILVVNIGGKSIVTSINNSKNQLFTSVYWKVTGRFIGLFFFFRELMEVILAKWWGIMITSRESYQRNRVLQGCGKTRMEVEKFFP